MTYCYKLFIFINNNIYQSIKLKMKKFYYIYEIKEDWGEKFLYKAFSEHSAIEWIKEQLNRPKYKGSKFKIQPIYKEGVLFAKDEST